MSLRQRDAAELVSQPKPRLVACYGALFYYSIWMTDILIRG